MTFVGVCGGRHYNDARMLGEVLSYHVRFDDVIVHGDADGADSLADRWALARGNHRVKVPAMWNMFSKSAGPRRNAVIAALPLRLLIAFPGGAGTADMVKQVRAKGVQVIEVEP